MSRFLSAFTFSAVITAIGLGIFLTCELRPVHAQSTELNSCNVQAYNIPGTYTYTVPQGVTSIDVTMWGGAGGGGGSQSGTYFYDLRWGEYYYSFGGAGGYSAGTISVTPGAKLTITVGGGGVACDLPSLYEPQGYCSGGWGGGGRGGISASDGSGGGMSAIAEGSEPLIIAGGGGGGSQGGSASGFTRYQGGAGGGRRRRRKHLQRRWVLWHGFGSRRHANIGWSGRRTLPEPSRFAI